MTTILADTLDFIWIAMGFTAVALVILAEIKR